MKEHIDIIIEGPPENYDSSIAFITNKSELLSIDEIETVLLAHESCIEKFHKKNVASINIVSTSAAPLNSNSDSIQATLVQQNQNQPQNPNQN